MKKLSIYSFILLLFIPAFLGASEGDTKREKAGALDATVLAPLETVTTSELGNYLTPEEIRYAQAHYVPDDVNTAIDKLLSPYASTIAAIFNEYAEQLNKLVQSKSGTKSDAEALDFEQELFDLKHEADTKLRTILKDLLGFEKAGGASKSVYFHDALPNHVFKFGFNVNGWVGGRDNFNRVVRRNCIACDIARNNIPVKLQLPKKYYYLLPGKKLAVDNSILFDQIVVVAEKVNLKPSELADSVGTQKDIEAIKALLKRHTILDVWPGLTEHEHHNCVYTQGTFVLYDLQENGTDNAIHIHADECHRLKLAARRPETYLEEESSKKLKTAAAALTQS